MEPQGRAGGPSGAGGDSLRVNVTSELFLRELALLLGGGSAPSATKAAFF